MSCFVTKLTDDFLYCCTVPNFLLYHRAFEFFANKTRYTILYDIDIKDFQKIEVQKSIGTILKCGRNLADNQVFRNSHLIR